jgi:hypothetical protein
MPLERLDPRIAAYLEENKFGVFFKLYPFDGSVGRVMVRKLIVGM